MSAVGNNEVRSEQILLICTVGGSPEPLVRTLLHWRPARVIFLPSEQTGSHVDIVLRDYAKAAGAALSPGQYEIRAVSDAEDYLDCVRSFRGLNAEVHSWLIRQGGDYRVVVDFTAGTKCMSAALALVARPWRCTFSYVGGARRTKDGVGVVETGTERVVHSVNPWDALGYQAVEDAVTVFNYGQYGAAAQLLDGALRRAGAAHIRRELATLKSAVEAYAAWDRFDHKRAAQCFADALKNRNDLSALFPDAAVTLTARLERHCDRVTTLANESEPTMAWVLDLLDNARRRACEQRFDDAVARLYRVIEALAQVRLRERHGIASTGAVTLDQLPASLREEWANRGRDGRTFMLGLQDAYRVLKEFGDELGIAFFSSGLGVDYGSPDSQVSPLIARNQSILAHGFVPVGENTYKQLYTSTMKLISAYGRDTPEANLQPDDWRLPDVTQTSPG